MSDPRKRVGLNAWDGAVLQMAHDLLEQYERCWTRERGKPGHEGAEWVCPECLQSCHHDGACELERTLEHLNLIIGQGWLPPRP